MSCLAALKRRLNSSRDLTLVSFRVAAGAGLFDFSVLFDAPGELLFGEVVAFGPGVLDFELFFGGVNRPGELLRVGVFDLTGGGPMDAPPSGGPPPRRPP